jgi:hypothetical protein
MRPKTYMVFIPPRLKTGQGIHEKSAGVLGLCKDYPRGRESEKFQGCNVSQNDVLFATGKRGYSGNRGVKLHGISTHHEQMSKGITSCSRIS